MCLTAEDRVSKAEIRSVEKQLDGWRGWRRKRAYLDVQMWEERTGVVGEGERGREERWDIGGASEK